MKIIYSILLIFCSYNIFSQITVYAAVDHLHPTNNDTIGNIKLSVSGSTAPYTYTWNPGSINTKDISNINLGTYSINITSASSQTYSSVINLGYKVLWLNRNRALLRNDTLMSSSYSSNATILSNAVSRNTLNSNTDGWFEYIISEIGTGSDSYIGFLDSISPNIKFNDIDFGIRYETAANDLWAVHTGTANFRISTNAKVGDVIRVQKIGNTINYYLNNVIVRTVSNASIGSKQYKLKASFATNNRFVNVGCSFNNVNNSTIANYLDIFNYTRHILNLNDSTGSIKITPKINSGNTYTWTPLNSNSNLINNLAFGTYKCEIADTMNNKNNHYINVGYKVDWTSRDRCALVNDSLYSINSASTARTSFAISKNTLKANQNGWIEHQFLDFNPATDWFVGFTDSVNFNYQNSTIDFGFRFVNSNNYLYYIENGTSTTVAVGNLRIGDVLRVERNGNNIVYKLNNETIRTTNITNFAQRTLKVQASLNGSPNWIRNVGCSFLNKDSIQFQGYLDCIPRIRHASTLGSNNGSIVVTPNVANSNSYLWGGGLGTANNIQSLSAGTYSLDLYDGNNNLTKHKFNVGYKTKWVNPYNLTIRNDSLINSSTIKYGTANSKNTLKSATNGWIEIVLDKLNYADFYLGFTDSISPNIDHLFYDCIDYGIYFNNSSDYLYSFESGTITTINSVPKIGDIIRIERSGNTIHYKINGITIRSVTISGLFNKNYKVAASILNTNISNVGCSFHDTTNVSIKNYISANTDFKHASSIGAKDGSIFLKNRGIAIQYIKSGTDSLPNRTLSNLSLGTYSLNAFDNALNSSFYNYQIGYRAQFLNVTNGFFRNDTIAANTTTTNYGYARSKNVISPNTNGYVQVTINSVTGYESVFGLTDSIDNNSSISTDIDYGFSINTSGVLQVYQNAALGSPQFSSLRTGDILRIERTGNTISYRLNGELISSFTNTIVSTKSLRFKVRLRYRNYLANVSMSVPACKLIVDAGNTAYITPLTPTVTLTATSNNPNITYTWSPTGSTPNNSVTSVSTGGIYTITVTDAVNSCTSRDTVRVISNFDVLPIISNYNSDTSKAAINLVTTGGALPYKYKWYFDPVLSNDTVINLLSNNLYTSGVDTNYVIHKLDSLRKVNYKNNIEPGKYLISAFDQTNDSIQFYVNIGNPPNNWVVLNGVTSNSISNYSSYYLEKLNYYSTLSSIEQSGTFSNGNHYAISGYQINLNEFNEIRFTVEDTSKIVNFGFTELKTSHNGNTSDMSGNILLKLYSNATFDLVIKDSTVFNSTYAINDQFVILTDSSTNLIYIYQNSYLITSIKPNSLNFDQVIPKITLGSPNAKLLKLFIKTPPKTINLGLNPVISYTLIDANCDNDCSAKLELKATSNFISTPGSFSIPGFSSETTNGVTTFNNLCANQNYIITYSYTKYNFSTQSYQPQTITLNLTPYFKPNWKNISNNLVVENTHHGINKTLPVLGTFDAGASSFNKLKSNSVISNFIEWNSNGLNSMGLTASDTDYNPNSVNYSFTSYNIGNVVFYTIKNNGTSLFNGVSNLSNKFRIEKLNDDLKFKVNNSTVLDLFNITPNVDLILDASLANGQIIKPRLNFNCELPNIYVTLKKELDASYYLTKNNALRFTMDGDYSTMNLNYKIYNASRNSFTGLPINQSSLLNGDNRFEINISSLSAGFYVLEVLNQKNEKLVLRFKK